MKALVGLVSALGLHAEQQSSAGCWHFAAAPDSEPHSGQQSGQGGLSQQGELPAAVWSRLMAVAGRNHPPTSSKHSTAASAHKLRGRFIGLASLEMTRLFRF
jgi:hypothetical protein